MTSTHINTRLFTKAREQFLQDCKERYTDSKDLVLVHDFLCQSGSPEEARKAAQSIKDDAGKKWGGRWSGDIQIPETWIDGLMGNIGNFVTVGDYAMTGAPESVGLAWFAVKLTLSAIQSNYELYGLFGSGLTDISEIMIIIAHYDRLYDERDKAKAKWKPSPVLDKLFKDIIATYAAVLDFSLSIRRHLSGGTLVKLMHGFKDFVGTSKLKFQAKLDTIAVLKKKILEASQAVFQDKSLQHLSAVQGTVSKIEVTVNDIKSFQTKMQELNQQTAANVEILLTGMEELKAATKAKTPWDLAVQSFDKYNEALAPMRNTGDKLGDAIDRRHPGTCRWIVEHPHFRNWRNSNRGLLCLSGQRGSGKSTVLATIVEQLELSGDRLSTLLYLSCASTSVGDSTKTAPTADDVCRTLLHQLYALARHDEGNVQLLESCNKVFENPKTNKDGKGKKMGSVMARATAVNTMPDFVDAFTTLVKRLGLNVTMALDELEGLSAESQQHLASKLTAALEPATGTTALRLVVGCRSDTHFYNHLPSSKRGNITLDVGDFNDDDMVIVLSDALRDVPGLTEDERAEATRAIIAKAGPRFSYVNDIGIPFMREPFHGLLHDRLGDLPKGMNTLYSDAILQMGPNYVGLLRKALEWTLLAPVALRVEEIMDAYHEKYAHRGPDVEAAARALKEKAFTSAPSLEVEQLRKASGPFLRLDQETDSTSFLVHLQDPGLVRVFCLQSDTPESAKKDHVCPRCKSGFVEVESIAISEKQSHLDLALACLRHVNNPVFQRKATVNDAVPQWSEEVEGVKEIKEAKRVHNESDGSGTGIQAFRARPKPAQTKIEPTTASSGDQASGRKGDSRHDHGYDSDESMDDEDRREDMYEEGRIVKGYVRSKSSGRRQNRYEMIHWMHHLREAQELWTEVERKSNKAWAAVFEELDYFTFVTPAFFRRWQQLVGVVNDQRSFGEPLHVAAAFGLTAWVEHLLKKGHDPNRLSTAVSPATALQAAAGRRNNASTMKLLLDHGGDPHIETQMRPPAFHTCLLTDPSLTTVQLWLDHGVNPTKADRVNGWTALHYFAWRGHDVSVLDLLLNHTVDGSEPNINARGPENVTPLHVLMWRREVPKQLLQAMLERGADANRDDAHSVRPLQMASVWGDVETLRILLDHSIVEIDDRDNDGDSALQQAAISDHVECMTLLADKGASVNLSNKVGRVALHRSALHGAKDCVETLLSHGAQLNVADRHNRTPLFFACLAKSSGVAELLLQHLLAENVPIVEINKLTTGNRSVLRQAASHGFDLIVHELIKRAQTENNLTSLALNVPDERKGMTPLHRAAVFGHVICVQHLLGAKADSLIRDKTGKTALVLAYEQWTLSSSRSDFEDIISMLIAAAPDTAIADAELPAICAANGSTRLLQQLSELGADLTRQDRYGWTPQQLARNFQRANAEQFLRKQAAWGGMLPSRWAIDEMATSMKGKGPILISEDGRTITHTSGERICISSDKPIPAGLSQFYFEVTCRTPETTRDSTPPEYPVVAVGFCTIGGNAIHFPGWPPLSNAPSAKSWGYHGDDGGLFFSGNDNGLPVEYGMPYQPGWTVGCGVDLAKGMMWFSLGGSRLHFEFGNVSGRLFPVVGFKDSIKVVANFEGPFYWEEK